jgi:predicted nucleotidyltransferase
LLCDNGCWYIEAKREVVFDGISMVEESVIVAVKRYLEELPTVGIHASKAVLFGSLTRGRADEYSDIDLVVIASEFDGPREVSVVETLWQATMLADNRIEPIPCGEQEWETEQGRPILEIARREGVVIAAQT